VFHPSAPCLSVSYISDSGQAVFCSRQLLCLGKRSIQNVFFKLFQL
jgi:hypothetical protein